MSPQESLQKKVQWGVGTEDGLFGRIVDGVYSNGDLAANFAGFMFYQNLLHPLKINQQPFPAILKKASDGTWFYNEVKENSKDQLLKRFFSDHFDESLNASVYERPQRYVIVRAIKSRCESWKEFYKLKIDSDYEQRIKNLKFWYGYEYGHQSEGIIDFLSLCYH